ncbi:CBS domain-containing protein [Saccharomonospora glauca]|jgi:CBS domain-containing protein|uniref:CBS-domain-containing membrane protein n=1 Tax=Saccharomonospora glauca K62 TaxID=928724 RepID=I1D3F4_9PSEU|nr:CBS domain-containing protein [Saccharomonospora glauca]EIE99478.1 CBS-domain-containing membrane protein [Saccharomonospora glauca K62]
MRAKDIMTSPVVTASPDDPVKRVTRLLTEHGFTALPVVDDADQVVGIVTEADVMAGRVPRDARHRSGYSAEPPPGTVAEVMTPSPTCTQQSEDVADLVSTLLEGHHRAVPVLAGTKLVGIVTRSDVVRALSRDDADIARDVRRRLMIYGGPDRWSVTVEGGTVTIEDDHDDTTDRHVATVLAESVPGVVRATVRHRERDPD